MSQVTLTIDGQSVTVPKGTLIVEAARQIGIEIPVYCYHPKLAPVGACRVCVVNVENQRRPIMPACATEVTEGMVVHTRDQAATSAREGVLELLLINHPLDCPVCDRAGECDLQDFTLRYGPPKSRFREEKRHFQKSVTVGKEVVLDRERCIMCMRCVRFCNEVAVEEGLTIIERGTKAEIGPFPGRSFDSQFSGNTVEICPVGALTSHNYRFKSRPWELQNFASVCTNCAVGCNVTVDVRYDHVARLRSRCNDAIDDGWLCDQGRYGFGFIHSEKRLSKPLVRKDGQLVEATWEEALAAAAAGLKKFSPKEVGAVAGPRLSNEGGWLLTRLVRSALNSGNLDQRRKRAWTDKHQPLPLSAKIEGLDTASAVLLVHSQPSKTHPVLELRIKKALQKGAGLVVVGDAGPLNRYADVRVSSLEELTTALEGWQEQEKPAIVHPKPRPWESGGKTVDDAAEGVKILKRSPRVVVFFDEDAPLDGVRELAEQLGCLNQAPHGLLMGVAGANSVGLREMGVLPVFAPGWQKLDQGAEALSSAWGGFSRESGMEVDKLLNGGVKGLILVAEDRLDKKPDFLVVIDIARSAAAEQADVVLPACSFAEQVQTFTNLDGTVQLARQALPPQADSLPDWKILTGLAKELGQLWEYDSASKVFAEIGRLNPLYKGSSYANFNSPAEVHWSYPQQGRLGTPRPDLSGIPVQKADATPWMPAVATGSRVERAARITAGDTPPSVPGQEDPRRVAARLSLESALKEAPAPIPEGAVSRIGAPSQAPQPPGPSPAGRYHQIGMGVQKLPTTAEVPAALPSPPQEEAPAQEEVTP